MKNATLDWNMVSAWHPQSVMDTACGQCSQAGPTALRDMTAVEVHGA